MIEIEKITPCEDPKFVKLQKVYYRQDGKAKSWEVAQTHDSVAILLYHEQKDAFVLVKQLRMAIYLKNREGFTYELCAGLVDKEKDLATIAQEEIEEECGYRIGVERLERITSFYTAVGFAGGKQTLFFATLQEEQKVSEGGGIEDEKIEVVYLPLEEARAFMFDESKAKTPGLMFAFMWFFDKYKK